PAVATAARGLAAYRRRPLRYIRGGSPPAVRGIGRPVPAIAGIPAAVIAAPAAAAKSTVETAAVKTAAVKASAMETAAVKNATAAVVRTPASAARFRSQGLHDDESRCQGGHGDA